MGLVKSTCTLLPYYLGRQSVSQSQPYSQSIRNSSDRLVNQFINHSTYHFPATINQEVNLLEAEANSSFSLSCSSRLLNYLQLEYQDIRLFCFLIATKTQFAFASSALYNQATANLSTQLPWLSHRLHIPADFVSGRSYLRPLQGALQKCGS